MAEPAYFPAAYPAFPPEITTYRGLYYSTGGAWRPVTNRPGHVVMRSEPAILDNYDARDEYRELTMIAAPPYYWAGLWYLDRFGQWVLHKQWNNWS